MLLLHGMCFDSLVFRGLVFGCADLGFSWCMDDLGT